jgi:hypothetical protein
MELCGEKNSKRSLPPLKNGESLRGVEGDLFKKSPLTPLFQRGELNNYEKYSHTTFLFFYKKIENVQPIIQPNCHTIEILPLI